ncbi:hypothetical protein [Amycolatopsis sp. CA-126428]|uniref:hypothetical protein n=1 Tax=Amycolatopsis sp. CA-126428 TaxID=2073158 RepID=UPI000CD2DB69|nr:hypothetical protein [Amycolatopsis sp. CA-126428]
MKNIEQGMHLVPAQTTPPVGISTTTEIVVGGAFVLVIVVAAVAPAFYDLRQANKWRAAMTAWLKSENFRRDDLIPVLRLIARTRGTTNVTRSTIAYLVVALVAAALGAVVFLNGDDAVDLRKTVITAVLTVFSSVIGFYFGSRSTQAAIEAQQDPPPDGGPTPADGARSAPETGPRA